jgi:hypothetical protein
MSIEIKGVDALVKKLGKVAAVKTLEPAMQRSVMRLQRDMAEYPPQRAGSRYIRGFGMEGGRRTSERLGQSWTTKVTRSSRGLVGKVGNNTTYGPFVQSSRFQAWMHKGRWQTDQDVIDKNRRPILRDFEREIEKAMR